MRLLFPLALLLCFLGASWMVMKRPETLRTHPYQGVHAPRLLDFNPAEVRNLRIKRGSEKCILRHKDGFWQLTSPLRDRVSQALPAVLIQLATQAQALDYFSLEEMRERGQTLEDYGLGQKAVRVIYSDQEDEALFHLEIGELCPWHVRTPSQQSNSQNNQAQIAEPTLYIRLPQSPVSERIFIIPAVVRGEMQIAGIPQSFEQFNLPHLLSLPFEQYRSAQLLPLSVLHASQLRWQTQDFTTEAQLQERGWQITSPIATPARNSSILASLQGLSSIPAYQLVDPKAIPFPENYATLTLRAPDLDGKEREFQLDIAQAKDISPNNPNYRSLSTENLLLVRPNHRKLLFTFEPKHQQWLLPQLKTLRSANLLNLEGWAIKEIAFVSPKDPEQPDFMLSIDQGQPTINWASKATEAQPLDPLNPLPDLATPLLYSRPADKDNVEELVTLLLRAQVSDFVSDAPADPAQYGLNTPELVLRLFLQKASPQANDSSSPQAQPASPMPLKRNLDLLIAQGPDGKWYAQRDDSISVFEVSPQLVAQIPLNIGFWRSKKLFDFSSSEILQIRRERDGYDAETLAFNPLRDDCQLTINQSNLSELLLPRRAQRLQKGLSQLRASGWISSPTKREQEALKDPQLSFEISVGKLDINNSYSSVGAPANNSNTLKYRLKLSALANPNPQLPALWLGQLDDEPSAFILSPQSVDLLAIDLIPPLDIQLDDSSIPPPPPPAPR